MSTADHPFEPEFVDMLREMFEQRIEFHRLLGLTVISFAPERPRARINMRDELIGQYVQRRLHGGVISGTLDAMGGFAAMLAIAASNLDDAFEPRLARFAKVGTIDLRIDYLRPAIGPHFLASAFLVRMGSRVATTRMEMHDSEDRLVAIGGAAYIVS
jgi:uncharacterized protein (TIGR00369 family)